MFDVYGWGIILKNGMFVFKDCEYFECIKDINYIWEKVFILVNLKFIMLFIKLKLYEDVYIMLKIVYEEVFLVLLFLDFFSF